MAAATGVSAVASRDGSAWIVPGWQIQQHYTQPPLLPLPPLLLLVLLAVAAVLLLLLTVVVARQ
jgi:hypothetical protein